MNAKLAFLIVAGLLFGGAQPAKATTYDFSYTFGNGTKVSGSFDGTDDGNLVNGYITNITNIQVVYNGTPLAGPLTAVWYDTGSAPPGQGPIVSFDPAKNKFAFLNSGYTPYNYFIFRQSSSSENVTVYTPLITVADAHPNGSWLVTVRQPGDYTAVTAPPEPVRTYDFSYTFSNNGGTVSGSFDGTGDGNVVSGYVRNITNINVSYGTTPFVGPLYASWYDFNNPPLDPSPVVSFDYRNNAFIFRNCDGTPLACGSPYNFLIFRHSNPNQNVVAYSDSPVTPFSANDDSPNPSWSLAVRGGGGGRADGLRDNGDGTFYDARLDVTFLANANYAKTSGYVVARIAQLQAEGVDPAGRIEVGGKMSLTEAQRWVQLLSYAGKRGWRLPKADVYSTTRYSATNELTHLMSHFLAPTPMQTTLLPPVQVYCSSAVQTESGSHSNIYEGFEYCTDFVSKNEVANNAFTVANCQNFTESCAFWSQDLALIWTGEAAPLITTYGGAPGTASGLHFAWAVHDGDIRPTGPADSTPPAIVSNVVGTAGNGEWYTSNVTLSWTATDAESSVSSKTGCDAESVTSDTDGKAFTCSATSAGGTSSESVTIRRDATPPTATGSRTPLPNSNGWNKSDVLVHYTGVDATSGPASCSADQTISSEGLNQSSFGGTCTDNAGNTSAATLVSGIHIDKTAPTVTATPSPAPNAAGWNKSAVTVQFGADDNLSLVAVDGCDAPMTLSSDGKNQSVNGTCRDLAGNEGSATAGGIDIDTTAPQAFATAAPAPNASGWNNSTVTVSFDGTDSTSGSGVASCPESVLVSAEGANIVTSGTCSDVAGNTSEAASVTVKLDSTAPSAAITTPATGATYQVGSAVNASYTCTDVLSGVASCAGTTAAGLPIDTSSIGTKSYSVTAIDNASNSATTTISYTVADTDTTPPVITPIITGTAGNSGWYRTNVVVSWTVTDPESTVTSATGCTSVTLKADTSSSGVTYTCNATSAGGSRSASVMIKRDAVAPTVTITTPQDKAVLIRGSLVAANYTCQDALSGLDSCNGTVANQTPIETATKGKKQFTVTAQDAAGNSRQVKVSYTVQ